MLHGTVNNRWMTSHFYSLLASLLFTKFHLNSKIHLRGSDFRLFSTISLWENLKFMTIKSDKWLSCRAQMFSIPFKCWGKWNLVWLKEYASGEMCEVFSKWSTWQPCWISECNGLSNIWSTTCSISQTQILFNSFNIFEGNLHWKIFLLWRQWNFLVAMTTKTSVKQNYLFWP